MKILLAYYSRTNSTRALASALQAELEKRGHSIDVEDVKPKKERSFWSWFFLRIFQSECEIIEPKIKDVSGYDAICIGSPNWTRLSLPMARYLNTISGLQFKNVFLFSTTALWPWFEWYIFSVYLLDITFSRIVSNKKARPMATILLSSLFKKNWGVDSLYAKNKIEELCGNIEHPPKSFKEFIINQKEIERSRFLITFFLGILVLSAVIQFIFKIIIFSEQKFLVFWFVNFFALGLLILLLQRKWRIYLIKYIAAIFLVLSLTLPHLFFHHLGTKGLVFSEIAFFYILALIFVSFWREYRIVLITGAMSLLGYYILFLSYLKRDSHAFSPFFDVSIIVLITIIISFIIRYSNRYYIEILENMDELEERSRSLEKTTVELKKEKIALFNILEDVKESELNLKAERDRIKAIVSSMSEGLLLVDKDLKIILINQMAAALIRKAPLEAAGKNLADVFHLRKGEKEFLNLNEVMEKIFIEGGNTVGFGLEDKIFCRNTAGRDFPIVLIVSPFLGDGITGAIIVFWDITKEKDLDEAKNSFISIASHQLRTPLTSIRWYAEMLDSEDVGPLNKDQKDFVARVYSGALKLNETINLLLALARIESAKTEIELTKLNLHSFTEDVLKELDPQIKQKNLGVELFLEKELPEINFDATMLRQVVSNLLSNSIRYTDKGGKIEIMAEKKGNEIIYSIKDNGIGIPESQQDKIFNKFFRAANAVSMVPDGSGLGLSLVKALTGLWGGKIWFSSEEKKGATFYFTIPLTTSNQQIITNNK